MEIDWLEGWLYTAVICSALLVGYLLLEVGFVLYDSLRGRDR
jgi:hypothetical protein